MTKVTLAVPKEIYEEVLRHPEIRWSEIARQAFQREIARLHLYDGLLEDSRLTEKDAVEIGRKIRRTDAKNRA